MSYLDLSHQINKNTPVYPGDPSVEIKPAGLIDVAGFQDHLISIGTHIGTHIDAPAHMIKDGATLDSYDVSRFTGTAVCVAAHDLDNLLLPDLKDIDAVFFYTGASDRYHEASYWSDYTVLPSNVIHELIEGNINIVGVDTGSIDTEEGFPVHKKFLQNDVLIIENLTNLKELANKAFEFTALPLNVALDGAPCRVIAKL